MQWRVRVEPGGAEFPVAEGQPILTAALQAGVPLRYGCSNGTCGQCRARVVRGETRALGPQDYVFRGRDAHRAMVLTCVHGAASDLVLKAALLGTPEEVPRQDITARVDRIRPLDEDTVELQLRTPRSEALEFLPGQHVMLEVPGLFPRYRSLSSCPCDGIHLSFIIRRVAGDAFAEYVFGHLRKGEPVRVVGPEGRFTLDDSSRRPLLFFCYDNGFAPVKSLIEHAIAGDDSRPITLYWMTVRQGQQYYANLCRSWVDALDRFRYIPLASIVRDPDGREAWRETEARDRIREETPELADHDVYVAGPKAVVAVVRDLGLSQGLPPERFFSLDMGPG